MRIAVLAHDRSELELVCSTLRAAGHVCAAHSLATDLMQHLRRDAADLLVMDWQPADDGADALLHWLRVTQQMTLPVLFLAGRANADGIARALAAGANDYMLKPLRKNELVTRVQTLLLRTYPNQHMPENLEFGRYVFETSQAKLSIGGECAELTQKEFELALLLFRNLGRPLSRTYILETVWSRDPDVPSRTLDTHISRVRNKLHLKPENGFRLAPVYSYGYRLEQILAQ